MKLIRTVRLRHAAPALFLLAAALTGCVSTRDSAAQAIFDGKTLNGWSQRAGKATYAVEDGCIVGTTTGDSANSFLCTTKDYSNFVLSLEIKADEGLNSGVQVRSHCYDYRTNFVANGKTNTIPAGRVHGYQIEVDHRPERRWSGGLYEEGRRGWLYSPTNNPAGQAAYKFGEWNQYRIECVGDSIKTWVNGVPVTDEKDSDSASGFIGLQVHGGSKAGLQVRFRNIMLSEKK